jgi:uncharacterized integral membrane protein
MADALNVSRRGQLKWAAWVLGCLLALLLLAWAWQSVDQSALKPLWFAVPLWGWLMAAVLWAGSLALRAERLRQEWKWKRQVAWREAMRVVLFHNAAVLLLPMRAGELGYPMLVKQVFGASWQASVRSLLWLRLQDLLVLATLALCLWPGFSWAWRVGAALIWVGLVAAPPRLWLWILKRRLKGMATVRSLMHRRSGLAGWCLSWGNWVLKLTAVAGLLYSLAPQAFSLGLQQALAGALGGELAALLPVQGPGGLGTYEAGVWLFSGLPLSVAPLMGLVALGVHTFCLAISLGLAGAWSLGSWPAVSAFLNPKR